MNRNTEQHFSANPVTLDMPRSRFVRDTGHKTTFSCGDIVPLLVDEILPGDTYNVDMSAVVRMSTPIYPVMDNAYMDTYWFFVPNRLVWQHWKEFMGENTTSKWEQTVEYTIPQLTAPAGGWEKGTIADYMGIPTKVPNISVSALPFRGLALIWNEWFRDQNLKDPAYVNLDDTNVQGSNGSTYQTDGQLGGKPFKAAKAADYFTKGLPAPQKGPSVAIPVAGEVPVVGNGNALGLWAPNASDVTRKAGALLNSVGDNYLRVAGQQWGAAGTVTTSSVSRHLGGDSTAYAMVGVDPDAEHSGLVAKFDQVTATTINELRQAFAVQRWYEQSARGGSRYRETIKAFFGVTSPDARMQVPEYLGGERVPINIDQVVQTSNAAMSGTSAATATIGTPQGTVAGFSHTAFRQNSFTKSFTEHGYIFCLGVIRTDHTYQQGIERMWSRKDKFDFYWPTFANLGEQAILNKEIYATGTAADDEVFAYQEAWAEYRYKPNRVSSAFRSNYAQPLDSWHYADYYTSQPILGSNWIDETTANVNRTIAVQDRLEDQFIGDFYFKMSCTRCMPVYSIPGLIDHH